MKTRSERVCIALCAMTLAAWVGCGDSPKGETDVSMEEVREETGEAADTMADYVKGQVNEKTAMAKNELASQRAALEDRAQAASDALEAEIESAKGKMSELSADARSELEAAIARAEKAKESAASELEDAREATSAQWTMVQRRLSAAVDEMAEAQREISAALKGDTQASS